ncbi:MAG: permease-like cell division protein FtsX [Hespellia sp.]|nr:permease-like cell division protein FtsX [Hespellia sp.]
MMTNKERYKQAFSVLHASGQISLEECKMQKKENKFTFHRVAVVIGMLVVCCSLFYLSENVYAYTDMTARVFMDKNIDENKIETIRTEIENFDGIKDVQYVSADQAWEDFQTEYLTGEQAEEFTENPLEDSQNFEMKVRKDTDMDEIQRQIEEIDGVRLVSMENQEG